MYYSKVRTSTDNWFPISLGNICNFTINNLDLANTIDVSSNAHDADIAEVFPNTSLTLDQNRFPYHTIYIRNHVLLAPANYQIWGW